MKTPNQNKKAFTLLELLVTLFIISVIISLSVVVYDVAWSRSRNSKRVSDVIRIQNALETYHKQEGKYPDSIIFGGDLTDEASSTVYMIDVPKNPSPRNDGDCANQEYQYSTSTDLYGNENFFIEFCIGNKSDQIEKGINCATSQGITSGACNPRNLKSGLKLWLKADGNVINHFVSSTPYVSAWNDESGSNNNSIQSNASSQPILINNALNGKPAIRFDGNDDRLDGTTITGLNTSSINIFIVAKGYSQSGIASGLFTIPTAINYNGFYFVRWLQSYESLNLTNNGVNMSSPSGTLPNSGFNFKVMEAAKEYNTKTKLFINMALQSTSEDSTLNGPFTNTNYSIGYHVDGYLNGEIAEVLIYDRLLNNSEKIEIYSYFQDKYGI